MEGNTSRLLVELTDAERAAFAEFQKADRRNSLSNAIIAAGLIGLDAWRNKGRPKAHHLAPAVGTRPEPTSPEAA